jgi:NAD(P)-dependent dehydrogenase (short-subunit alcohol dehydrogenase family)
VEAFAVRHLARLVPVEKTGVIINLICPGLCVTNLGRHASEDFLQRLRQLHAQYGRTAEDGSRTLLHGAVAGPESHGKLLHSCRDGE